MLAFVGGLLPKVMAITAVILVCVEDPESPCSLNGKYEDAHGKGSPQRLASPRLLYLDSAAKVEPRHTPSPLVVANWHTPIVNNLLE